MTTVEKCCCGCPLREGSFTIVNLDLIFKIIHIVSLFGADKDAYGLRPEPPNFIVIALLLLHPIFGIAGIIKKIPLLLSIYVVGSCILLLIYGVFIFLFIVQLPNQLIFLIIKMMLFGLWALHVYLASVVYKYYKELKNELTSPGTAAVI